MRKESKRKYPTGTPDPSEKIYYHFRIDPSRYMLYDSEMGEPVDFGSSNKVAATIKKLSKTCTIFYFIIDQRQGWKLKAVYKANNAAVDMEERRDAVKEVEESKK